MTGHDDDIVFLDDVLGAIEARLGVALAALDADDLGELVYGLALLERLEAEGERDPADLVPIAEAALTTADWAFLREVEVEHGIRLVAFHWGADAVVYGGDLIDEIAANLPAKG
jgi:hypothetical protein